MACLLVAFSGQPAATGTAAASVAAAASGTTASSTTSASSSAPATTAAPTPTRDWSETFNEWAERLTFEEWPSPIFEADFWQSTMHGVRVVLPLLLAALLLTQFAVHRGHGRVPRATVSRLAWLFISLGFLTHYEGFNPNSRHPGLYSPQAFYQQYLGVKYRAELETGWLFDCTVAAEKQLGRTSAFAKRYVRSHVDPESLVPVGTSTGALRPERCESRFTQERWSAFKNDVEALTKVVSPQRWSAMLERRWFVAAPGWTALVAPLVEAPVSEARFRVLALMDPALHLVALLALLWAFGPRVAAIAAVVWGAQPFLAFDDGVGLLQNAWVALLMTGLCALKKHRSSAGGVALAAAMALQPWTVVVVTGALVTLVFARRSDSSRRRALTPLWVWALSLAFFLGVSVHAQPDHRRYTSELALQLSIPELEDVGLATALAATQHAPYRLMRNDSLANPAEAWSIQRARSLSETRVPFLLLFGGLLAWLLWSALRARQVWFGAALGAAALTALTQPLSTSIGVLALVPLCARRAELAPALLLGTAACEVVWTRTHFPDHRATSVSVLLLLIAAVAVIAVSPTVHRYLFAFGPKRASATPTPSQADTPSTASPAQ